MAAKNVEARQKITTFGTGAETDDQLVLIKSDYNTLANLPDTFPPTSHEHSVDEISETTYTTTTPTTEGYYRIASIPLSSSKKQLIFKIKAVTSTSTATESLVFVDVAYNAASTSAQTAALSANTSHSYNSQTGGDPGHVILYVRYSMDATNAYLDIYKYKSLTTTIEVTPRIDSDWTFTTGALTVNPTVGSVRSTSVTTSNGFCSNGGYVSSSGSSTYTYYGMVGGDTYFNHGGSYLNYWAYIGYISMDYNSSYPEGKSGQFDVKFQELSMDGSKSVSLLEDFTAKIKVNLSTMTTNTGAFFNSTVPTYSIELEGNTTRGSSDIAAFVYSTTESTKIIRV